MNSMSSEIIKSRLNDHLPWMLYENNRIGERVEWACAYIPIQQFIIPPKKILFCLSFLTLNYLVTIYFCFLSKFCSARGKSKPCSAKSNSPSCAQLSFRFLLFTYQFISLQFTFLVASPVAFPLTQHVICFIPVK